MERDNEQVLFTRRTGRQLYLVLNRKRSQSAYTVVVGETDG